MVIDCPVKDESILRPVVEAPEDTRGGNVVSSAVNLTPNHLAIQGAANNNKLNINPYTSRCYNYGKLQAKSALTSQFPSSRYFW